MGNEGTEPDRPSFTESLASHLSGKRPKGVKLQRNLTVWDQGKNQKYMVFENLQSM